MKSNESKELPAGMKIQCYACKDQPATHVCRYQVDELLVQVCLCKECMKIDTEYLLKNTIGIRDASESAAQKYLMI